MILSLALAAPALAEGTRVLPLASDLSDSQKQLFSDFDAAIETNLPATGTPGFVVLFVRDDGPLWGKAYGFADVESGREATLETPFGIGSISKTFIGAALMTEIEAGRVRLDQPLDELLPFEVDNPRVEGDRIEVRHIVTHSSGIKDHRKTYPATYADGDPDPDFGAFLGDYLVPGGKHYDKKNFLAAAPGQKQVYSNIGATVGALVVETAAKKPYAEVVSERLLKPLEMGNSGFMIADFDEDVIAVPYEGLGKGKMKRLELFGYRTYPDGQLRSSALDLGNYVQMLLSEGRFRDRQVLSKESVETLLAKQLPNSAAQKSGDEGFGVYWVVGANRSAQHSGGDPGIAAQMAFNRNRGVGVILLLNTDNPGKLFKHIGSGIGKILRTFDPASTERSD